MRKCRATRNRTAEEKRKNRKKQTGNLRTAPLQLRETIISTQTKLSNGTSTKLVAVNKRRHNNIHSLSCVAKEQRCHLRLLDVLSIIILYSMPSLSVPFHHCFIVMSLSVSSVSLSAYLFPVCLPVLSPSFLSSR